MENQQEAKPIRLQHIMLILSSTEINRVRPAYRMCATECKLVFAPGNFSLKTAKRK